MASTINALTTGVGGIQSTGDTSGEISLQSNGSTVLAMTASGVAVTGTMTVGGNSVLNAGSTVTVAQGGTGATSLTANNVVLGNGTSAVQFVAPGSSGNVLTSNGTTWTSAAAGGGQLQSQLFTAPGTWTKPSSATQVRVTVIGGGGGGSTGFGGNGGSGGLAIATNVPVSGPVAVTVGSGGAPGNPTGVSGGSSSFGPAVSATGGSGAPTGIGGGQWAPSGGGTVSSGTAIKTGTFQDMTAFNNNPAPTSGAYTYGYVNVNGINGSLRNSSPGSYSTSGGVMAGAAGAGSSAYGLGGAVLVEFVG